MNTHDVVQHVTQTVTQNKAATLVDVGSITLVGATLMDFISPIAALASLLWVGMRIYLSYKEIKQMHAEEKKNG